MSVTITFELDDSDIEHFRALAQEAQEAAKSTGVGAEKITAGARELFQSADTEKMPDFVSGRLASYGRSLTWSKTPSGNCRRKTSSGY